MRKLALTMIALALGVLALTPTVAFAHHEEGHGQGPPDRQAAEEDRRSDGERAETTEDEDADGHPDCPDPAGDEDNRHPSGNDQHCEAGGSGSQGGAQHDPDDDGNGPDRGTDGADQPGGQGGEDQLDQDGNNGCGNDDDFEDDNEGWCGKPDREQPAASEQDEQEDAAVAGISETREQQPVVDDTGSTDGSTDEVGTDGSDDTAVLGIQLERAPDAGVAAAGDETADAAPNALARTGIPAVLLGLLGLGLLTAGYGLRRHG